MLRVSLLLGRRREADENIQRSLVGLHFNFIRHLYCTITQAQEKSKSCYGQNHSHENNIHQQHELSLRTMRTGRRQERKNIFKQTLFAFIFMISSPSFLVAYKAQLSSRKKNQERKSKGVEQIFEKTREVKGRGIVRHHKLALIDKWMRGEILCNISN